MLLFLQAPLLFLQPPLLLQTAVSLELVAKGLWGSVGCLRGCSCLKASGSLKAYSTRRNAAVQVRDRQVQEG
jgi:hypothetical protein